MHPKWNIILLVNVGPFLEPLAAGAGLDGPLRPGQIDERHPADFLAADAALPIGQRLRQDDGEDGVRPRGLVVHVGRGHRPVLVALHHEVVDLLKRGHGQLRQPVHIRTQDVVLSNPEAALKYKK